MDIHISNNAAEYVKQKLNNAQGIFALRVYVKSVGCCSVDLGTAFDEVRPSDNIYTAKGVKIVIDKKMAKSIAGFNVDIMNSFFGTKLIIEDNHKGSC